MDTATETRTGLTYIKVCVEVDLSKDLPSTIPLYMGNSSVVNIEVEYT